MLESLDDKQAAVHAYWEAAVEKEVKKHGYFRVYTPHICKAELAAKHIPKEFFPSMSDPEKGNYSFGVPKYIFHAIIAGEMELTIHTLPIRLYEFDQVYKFNPISNRLALSITAICAPEKIGNEYDTILRICRNAEVRPFMGLDYVASDNKKHAVSIVYGVVSQAYATLVPARM